MTVRRPPEYALVVANARRTNPARSCRCVGIVANATAIRNQGWSARNKVPGMIASLARLVMSARADIVVVIYIDQHYTVPATVMIRSLIENSAPRNRFHVFVLGIDLSMDAKRVMTSSWPKDRLDVHFTDLDLAAYDRSFAPVNYLTKAAYARLLIDRCLPPSVERVVTLDCDGVVLADIDELWQRPHRRHAVMAVRDPCVRLLGDDRSRFIPQRSTAPYFNSGLMVIDLRRWREERISDRCLALAERHSGEALYADQSILNAVLRGEWDPLPLRWNCNVRHVAIHSYPSLRDQVYPWEEVIEATERPAFVHFLSGRKPWHEVPFHPHREVYRKYLRRTQWCDPHTRVPPLRMHMASLVDEHAFPWRCYRQAERWRRGQRIPGRKVADLRHLLSSFVVNRARCGGDLF